MNDAERSLGSLVDEYETVASDSRDSGVGEAHWQALRDDLVRKLEWTDSGVVELVDLVRSLGASMVRNMLAVELAAGLKPIQDPIDGIIYHCLRNCERLEKGPYNNCH